MELAPLPFPGVATAVNASGADTRNGLSPSQKAAIILRMIQSDGGTIPITTLSERGQTRLARDFVTLGRVDKSIIKDVMAEFEAEVGRSGLIFPSDISDTLSALEGQIDPALSRKMRVRFGLDNPDDPWPDISALPPEILASQIGEQHPKVAAVILSNLPAIHASAVVEQLAPDIASSVAFAISEIESINPVIVTRIGATLLSGNAQNSATTLLNSPVDLVAAILNVASAAQRDAVVAALTELHPEFAALVRKAIFTFGDIPARIAPADIPKVARAVATEDLVTALTAAQDEMADAVEHILSNMSQRMADQLREEISEKGAVNLKTGEAAMSMVTNAIAELRDQGELTYLETDPAE